MRAAIFVPAFAAAVLAQESSVSGDSFPQTSFLTQTNSLGVITGMPSAETSQPAVAPVDTSIPAVETSVGEAASIPAVGTTGLYTLPVQGTAGVNSTQTIVVSANNSTTIVVSTIGVGGSSSTPTATGTGAEPSQTDGGNDEESQPSGSATGTGSAPDETGAAAAIRAVAGSVAGLGAFVAAFL